MMNQRYGKLRSLGVLCLLAALGGCDEGMVDDASTGPEPELVQHQRSAGSGECGYAYDDANFDGKQVALSPTGECGEPLTELFGDVGSVALSPNCNVELFLDDGSSITHSASSSGAARPSPLYQSSIGGAVTRYSCSCSGSAFPLVAEAQEALTRNIAAGQNTLPLWARGLVELGSVADGGWLNGTIAALYYPSGKGAIYAELSSGGNGVAFPVGAQAGVDKTLDLKTEYSVGIASEGGVQASDYQDISSSISFLDPYRVD